MAILIRTRDVPPEELRDAWRTVVCDTLGPLDFRSDPDIPLQGEIAAGQLGPVNVGRVETSTPHSVYRTPGLIRRDSPELYRVALAMSGHACLLQDGRTARLGPGEFTLYDFTRPYELAYDSGVQLAVFSFPREMLALPGDLVGRLTAVPVRTDTGTGALTAPLLGRVAARRVAGEHAADTHPRLHRAAPGRLRPGSRPGRGRALHLGALPVPAVRGAGDDGGRMDQAPAPRTLPRGPGRPGPGQRAGGRRRGALGPAGLGSLQPVVQAHLRVAAGRIPAGIPDAR